MARLAPRRVADITNAMIVELVPNNENYETIYPESEGTFHRPYPQASWYILSCELCSARQLLGRNVFKLVYLVRWFPMLMESGQ